MKKLATTLLLVVALFSFCSPAMAVSHIPDLHIDEAVGESAAIPDLTIGQQESETSDIPDLVILQQENIPDLTIADDTRTSRYDPNDFDNAVYYLSADLDNLIAELNGMPYMEYLEPVNGPTGDEVEVLVKNYTRTTTYSNGGSCTEIVTVPLTVRIPVGHTYTFGTSTFVVDDVTIVDTCVCIYNPFTSEGYCYSLTAEELAPTLGCGVPFESQIATTHNVVNPIQDNAPITGMVAYSYVPICK